MIELGVGVWVLGWILFLWWFMRGDNKPSETYVCDEVSDEDDAIPTIHVFCDYNPDEVKMFYEIPDALGKLIQSNDSDLTFTECLAFLIDIKENE